MKFTCFILDSIEPNNNYLFWIWANFLFYGMST
jgi:hypothetical protein